MKSFKPRPPRTTTRKKRGFGKVIIALFFIGIIATGVAAYIAYNQYETSISAANSEITTKVDFAIAEGSTIETIKADLIVAELLNEDTTWALDLYLRQTGLGATIQAGAFKIPRNLTIIELVDTLQEAGIPDVWVTIPEGLRMDEIATIIAKEYNGEKDAVFNRSDFLALTKNKKFMAKWGLEAHQHLEGYVYPDKYRLPLEATSEYVLTTLVDTFFVKAPSELTYQELIIASLAEREAVTPEDRKLVTGIIYKRLEEGWFLGLDVTFLYYHKDWKRELTYADLQEVHPYNNRIQTGLPPTPISNPGGTSLDAAKNPTESSYYYFIADKQGNMHYATTDYEHNQNIAKYLQ